MFIIEDLDNSKNIHTFNRFKEDGNVERLSLEQCHFMLVDLVRDILYAQGTP